MPGWAHRVTLAQLMHHSSGIPDYFGDLGPKGWEEATLNRQDALAKISAARKLRFQPGTKWEYSNSNYLLLGVVIEHVSGQPLETFLKERIFDPLQLRMVADPGQEMIPGGARSYRQPGSAFENVNWHFYALGPSDIWSTSADLVRWADNYRNGSVGGPALLTRRLMERPRRGSSPPATVPGYGTAPGSSSWPTRPWFITALSRALNRCSASPRTANTRSPSSATAPKASRIS
jgi:CubicO group peptidase (beta-lactamase class C family)